MGLNSLLEEAVRVMRGKEQKLGETIEELQDKLDQMERLMDKAEEIIEGIEEGLDEISSFETDFDELLND